MRTKNCPRSGSLGCVKPYIEDTCQAAQKQNTQDYIIGNPQEKSLWSRKDNSESEMGKGS